MSRGLFEGGSQEANFLKQELKQGLLVHYVQIVKGGGGHLNIRA